MSWKHIRDATPVARREHQCYLCEQPIPAGEQHVRRVGRNDGGFDSFRMHAYCDVLSRDWDEYQWESPDSAEFRRQLEARWPNPNGC